MKISKTNAFTLIELLVVISIIAILAGIALPAFAGVQVRAAQSKILSNAKQVGLACRVFANDYDGQYPSQGINANGKLTGTNLATANAVFATLIPDYLQTEQIFFCAKSKFTPAKPDDNITSADDRLKTGENHFAYVLGLGTTSNSTFPLLADGFASESDHTYVKDETAKGGVWKGKVAIVIRADQSGIVEKLGNDMRVHGGPDDGDLFASRAEWLGADNTVVNPK